MKKLIIIKLVLWLIKFVGRDVEGFYSWDFDLFTKDLLEHYKHASNDQVSEQVADVSKKGV